MAQVFMGNGEEDGQGDDGVQDITDSLNTAHTKAGILFGQWDIFRLTIKRAVFCKRETTWINEAKLIKWSDVSYFFLKTNYEFVNLAILACEYRISQVSCLKTFVFKVCVQP